MLLVLVMKIRDVIAAIPLFEGLADAQLDSLASIAHSRDYERGRTIFSEGDEAAGLYVVAAGRVKIYKMAPDGKEQILHLFGPGELFGEVAVFSGRRFPAYAEALEKCGAIFFPRSALLELIGRNPDLALGMLAILSIRLRRFTHLIEDLSLKEVPGRLAAYLLFLSAREGAASDLELDVTKTQLAGLLGTIPETLSRMLAKMSREGLIEVDGKRIRLLDREGLEDLSGAQARLAELKIRL
ncbi:MAG: Crp/Fnr family transcriptional regulator [Pseudomonadota bacterium]